jgi:serine/threonine-protein kinase PknG
LITLQRVEGSKFARPQRVIFQPPPTLREAAKRLEESRVDGERRIRLDAELLEAGLEWLRAGRTAHQGADLLGLPLAEDGLRRKLERRYRELARLATDINVKHVLLAKANAARSRTFM